MRWSADMESVAIKSVAKNIAVSSATKTDAGVCNCLEIDMDLEPSV